MLLVIYGLRDVCMQTNLHENALKKPGAPQPHAWF